MNKSRAWVVHVSCGLSLLFLVSNETCFLRVVTRWHSNVFVFLDRVVSLFLPRVI